MPVPANIVRLHFRPTQKSQLASLIRHGRGRWEYGMAPPCRATTTITRQGAKIITQVPKSLSNFFMLIPLTGDSNCGLVGSITRSRASHATALILFRITKGAAKMKVLVACEESQAVTIELRKLGHEAYSCDIIECSGGHPEWHIKQDVIPLLKEQWDMIIAFPPCTHLAASGARHFAKKQADGRQENAINFFMKIANANCKKIAIENPIGIMSTQWRKPDQIIQPWQFGHGETKATCIWLKGLPLLIPTNIVNGREQRIWKMSPGPNRAKERSKTYPGIAKAMAEQWTK